jgi:predicted MFS family arabinose efflux permease
MPVPVHSEFRIRSRRKRNFGALYTALMLLSLHWAVVLYINSSYLEQFVSSKTVGLLYMGSSLLTIIFFLAASRMLSVVGNYPLTLGLTILECAVLFGMAGADSPTLAVVLFVIHQAVVPLILFGIDVFMEEMVGDDENATGGKRGILLTIMNITTALAALGAGFLIGEGVPQFSLAYSASALLLTPFIFLLMRHFKTFKDPQYPNFELIAGFKHFWKKRDVRNVFFSHFTLQLFFAWMVIYTPIYLATEMGFNWEEIGQILFVGLMAYVLLEYVVGVAADKWFGEKEMMAFGFVIIAVSCSSFVFLDEASIAWWMLAMFMTRVGASLVEATTESYFFKHTEGKDTNLISFFRLTRPLSIVVGALLGSIALSIVSFELMFILLALLMLPGLFYTMALKDTR